MSDIVTSRLFTDGEKNITAAKLNDIVASSVIQPAFVSAKPSTSTVAPTDNLLILTAAGGTYAKAPFQTVIDSVNASLNTNSAIWSARLRSFQALNNNTFEVDQRNVGNTLAAPAGGTLIQDRWQYGKAGTMACSIGQQSVAAGINLPGTSFAITRNFLRITLTTAQASLAATDNLSIIQQIEGPRWRELQNDVHSFQIMVRTSVAGLSFGVALRDSPATKSLTNILTIPSANTWTLLTLAGMPLWPAGNFVNTPGNVGYILNISLAAGSTYTSPANTTWQNGNFTGATGQSNFAASPVNSTIDIAYISHEPGALCSNPPMDCPFTQNYDDCLRYYQKTYDYLTIAGTPTTAGLKSFISWAIAAAYGGLNFHKPMAKTPTITLYDHNNGAANSVMDGSSVHHTGAAASFPGISGFGAITFTTATTSTMQVYAQYIADTGL
jgi:hypothetical protein